MHLTTILKCTKQQLILFTFGLIWSSSPLLSLHSTCCVASPPIPKFKAWSGENSFLQTWHKCTKNSDVTMHQFHYRCVKIGWCPAEVGVVLTHLRLGLLYSPRIHAKAVRGSLQQREHQALSLCYLTRSGCAARVEKGWLQHAVLRRLYRVIAYSEAGYNERKVTVKHTMHIQRPSPWISWHGVGIAAGLESSELIALSSEGMCFFHYKVVDISKHTKYGHTTTSVELIVWKRKCTVH